jgi:ABC-type molybdate transport system ATPase subunit
MKRGNYEAVKIYYAEFGRTTIVLILGGAKNTQDADIKKAGKILADMKQKHLAAKQKREAQQAAQELKPNSTSGTKSKRK